MILKNRQFPDPALERVYEYLPTYYCLESLGNTFANMTCLFRRKILKVIWEQPSIQEVYLFKDVTSLNEIELILRIFKSLFEILQGAQHADVAKKNGNTVPSLTLLPPPYSPNPPQGCRPHILPLAVFLFIFLSYYSKNPI